MDFRLSAPNAFDALLMTALASCPLFAQDQAVQDNSIKSENATINFFATVSLL